jgi:hypothetical protein
VSGSTTTFCCANPATGLNIVAHTVKGIGTAVQVTSEHGNGCVRHSERSGHRVQFIVRFCSVFDACLSYISPSCACIVDAIPIPSSVLPGPPLTHVRVRVSWTTPFSLLSSPHCPHGPLTCLCVRLRAFLLLCSSCRCSHPRTGSCMHVYACISWTNPAVFFI